MDNCTFSLDDARNELADLLDALRETQAALRSTSARVLADPAAEEEAEPERSAQLQRRRELLARIASLALRVVDAGASLEIHATAPALLLTTVDAPATVDVPPLEVDPLDTAQCSYMAQPLDTAQRSYMAQPLDTAQLQVAIGPAWTRAPHDLALDVEHLRSILARLSTPPDSNDAAAHASEVERLAAEMPRIAEWTSFPKHIQRHLVAMVAARARSVQIAEPTMAQPVARIFSTLTKFSANERPGFVIGLMRDSEPRGATWLADAVEAHAALCAELSIEEAPAVKLTPERALDELRAVLNEGAEPDTIADTISIALDAGLAPDDVRLLDLLAPDASTLATALGARAKFKRLRRALRDHLDADEDDDQLLDSSAALVPVDWPHWPATLDKRAVVIGGDLREDARIRLERAFQFRSLAWITTEHMRGVQQVGQTVSGGTVDLAIVLLRFIGHAKAQQVLPVCKQSGVPWIVVERGYGVAQVRLAIERFL